VADKKVHPLDQKTRGKETRPATIRKLAGDGPSWTPTEKRKRDGLLKQFSARAKGFGVGISQEYRDRYDEIDWAVGATDDDLKSSGGKK
jgi:hypothetical protein